MPTRPAAWCRPCAIPRSIRGVWQRRWPGVALGHARRLPPTWQRPKSACWCRWKAAALDNLEEHLRSRWRRWSVHRAGDLSASLAIAAIPATLKCRPRSRMPIGRIVASGKARAHWYRITSWHGAIWNWAAPSWRSDGCAGPGRRVRALRGEFGGAAAVVPQGPGLLTAAADSGPQSIRRKN